MKGVYFVINDKNKKIAVQIDLKTITKHQASVEGFLNTIIEECCKHDEYITSVGVKKKPKKTGKR